MYSGDCYCTCPNGKSGKMCQNSKPYARLDILLDGETEDSFSYEKTLFVIEGIANLAEVEVTIIEIDTIKNNDGLRRAQAINMVTRVVTQTTREAQRMAQKLTDGLLDGRLSANIANASGASGVSWPVQTKRGTYLPIPFDSFGRELCDGEIIICQTTGGSFTSDQLNSSSAGNESGVNTRSILTFISAAFGATILAILGWFSFWWCRKRYEGGPGVDLTSVKMFLPQKKRPTPSRYLAMPIQPNQFQRDRGFNLVEEAVEKEHGAVFLKKASASRNSHDNLSSMSSQRTGQRKKVKVNNSSFVLPYSDETGDTSLDRGEPAFSADLEYEVCPDFSLKSVHVGIVIDMCDAACERVRWWQLTWLEMSRTLRNRPHRARQSESWASCSGFLRPPQKAKCLRQATISTLSQKDQNITMNIVLETLTKVSEM